LARPGRGRCQSDRNDAGQYKSPRDRRPARSPDTDAQSAHFCLPPLVEHNPPRAASTDSRPRQASREDAARSPGPTRGLAVNDEDCRIHAWRRRSELRRRERGRRQPPRSSRPQTAANGCRTGLSGTPTCLARALVSAPADLALTLDEHGRCRVTPPLSRSGSASVLP
jgi:hypothetical protein